MRNEGKMPSHVQKYILHLPSRIATLLVAEFPDKIIFKLDLQGDRLGDVQNVVFWLRSILEQYDNDRRPLFIGDPLTGYAATSVHGDARS
jgi:hypothetical protein